MLAYPRLTWLVAAALLGFASNWCVVAGPCDAALIVQTAG